MDIAFIYSDRAFLFSVMIHLEISFEKIFQSVGKMKISMVSMMCGFAVNIILDPLLIFGPGIFPAMGIAGAAYATGVGQIITLLVYLLCFKLCPIPVKIERKYMRLEKIYRTTLGLTMGVMLMGTLLAWTMPRWLTGLFTAYEETVRIGVDALHIISLGFAEGDSE